MKTPEGSGMPEKRKAGKQAWKDDEKASLRASFFEAKQSQPSIPKQ